MTNPLDENENKGTVECGFLVQIVQGKSRVHTDEDDETFTDEDSVSLVGQTSIQIEDRFDAINHESEV